MAGRTVPQHGTDRGRRASGVSRSGPAGLGRGCGSIEHRARDRPATTQARLHRGRHLATVAATGSGLVLLSLAVTYLVPVASAVAERRQLASTMAALGEDGIDVVVGAWTGNDFGVLDQHLVSLAPALARMSQHHLAYPVLHYFHSREPSAAAAPRLRALADALLLLSHGIDDGVRLSPAAARTLERALDIYLATLHGAFIAQMEEPLPPPDRSALARAGIPLAPEDGWREAVEGDAGRRRLLAGLLREDGWGSNAGAPGGGRALYTGALSDTDAPRLR